MSYTDARDFAAEYETITNGLNVKIEKSGGGTVGKSYGGRWRYLVSDVDGNEIARGQDFETGMPASHAGVATMLGEYFARFHWVIGYNVAGCLPTAEPVTAATWQDACDTLESAMTDYADSDDDSAWQLLPTDYVEAEVAGYQLLRQDGPNGTQFAYGVDYGDDAPSMRATVDSIMKDNGPHHGPAHEWSASVADNDGNRIEFWIKGAHASD